mgnify:CR=1 FL=1
MFGAPPLGGATGAFAPPGGIIGPFIPGGILPMGPFIILPIMGDGAPLGWGFWAAQKYTATMIANTMMMTITATAGLTCFPLLAN